MFGLVNTNGVIKNVAFINAKVNGGSGLISSCGSGTVQNVYAQIIEQGNGNPNNADKTGFFCSGDAYGGAKVNDCFVDTVYTGTVADGGVAFGSFHNGFGSVNGAFCVGNANAFNHLSTGNASDFVCGSYATKADMKAASDWQEEFATWDTNFWTTDADGLPIFKSLVD